MGIERMLDTTEAREEHSKLELPPHELTVMYKPN